MNRIMKATLIVTILLLVGNYFFIREEKLYGNDPQSIIKVIQSIDSYTQSEIVILEIKDIDEHRIVSFLANNKPAFISYTQNEKGNYLWNYARSENGEPFSMFLPSPGRDIKKMLFVTSNESKLSKIEVDINGIPIEQSFAPFQASVSWVDLPESADGSYEYRNYRYYDEHGQLME